MFESAEKSDCVTEINSENVSIQRGKVDFSSKFPAFCWFNWKWRDKFVRKLLKLRCSFAIIGLEFQRSVSGKVSKR